MKIFVALSCILTSVIATCQLPATKATDRSATKTKSTYEYRTPSPGGTGKFYMGREIAQIMDASGSAWLERSSRPNEENTSEIIAGMQLSPDMVVADIGAGTGYYTFKVAPLLNNGKVYAVEIQEELLDKLRKKKETEKIANVEVVRGDTKQINLPPSSCDLIFMVDVYHELSWPAETLQSISRSLKPNGKLVLIEYRGEDPALRIKPLHKTTIKQLTRELAGSGFKLTRKMENLPMQHLLVFENE